MNTALSSINEIIYLPLEKIKVNPYQPRKFFDRTSLEELARSIQEYGVLQPINVRLINGCSYELVAGERRLRASKIAGLEAIPCIIINITDKDSAIIAIIENLQRQNLNYLEEAEGFQNLIHDYTFSQEKLAEIIGKSQSTIANKLRLLKLSKKIQKILLENDLSERHARSLLKISDEDKQQEILEKVVKNNLTVKKTEDLVESELKKKNTVKPVDDKKVKRYIKDIRLFTNTIKQAVDLMNKSGIATCYKIEQTGDGYEINITVLNT